MERRASAPRPVVRLRRSRRFFRARRGPRARGGEIGGHDIEEAGDGNCRDPPSTRGDPALPRWQILSIVLLENADFCDCRANKNIKNMKTGRAACRFSP